MLLKTPEEAQKFMETELHRCLPCWILLFLLVACYPNGYIQSAEQCITLHLRHQPSNSLLAACLIYSVSAKRGGRKTFYNDIFFTRKSPSTTYM